MNTLLIYPMFSMVLLTLFVAVILLKVRIKAALSGTVQMRYYKTFTEGEPTEEMLKASQHFTNLFEIPVLFYAGCLAAMQTEVTKGIIISAWIFVLSRVAHAVVHIGSNRVKYRMRAYLLSWLALMGLWTGIIWNVAQS